MSSNEILHIFAHQPLSAFTGLQEARKKNNREYRNTIYDSCVQRKDDARLTKRFVVILVSGN